MLFGVGASLTYRPGAVIRFGSHQICETMNVIIGSFATDFASGVWTGYMAIDGEPPERTKQRHSAPKISRNR